MATDLEITNSALTKLGAGLISSVSQNTKEATLAAERLPHLRKALIRSHPWNFATKRADSVTITSTASDSVASGTTLAVEALGSALPANLAITFSGGGVFTITPNTIAAEATAIVGNLTGTGIASGETASTWTTVGSALANTAPDFEYSYSIPLPTDLLRLLDVNEADGEYRLEGSNLICNQASPNILYIYDVSNYALLDPIFTEALAWALAHDMSYAISQSQGVWEMTQAGFRKSLSQAKTADAQEDGRYHIDATLFDESRYGSSIFSDYRNHYRP